MPITAPNPFAEALAYHARRTPLPTNLDSAGLRKLGAEFHRQSLVSARTPLVDYMNRVGQAVQSLLEPTEITRPDRVTETNPEGRVQVGLDPASARMELRTALAREGFTVDPEDAGTLVDLSSDRRIDLVLRTNTQLAQGAGNFVRSNDPALIDLWPAQELYRLEGRAKVRDWEARWLAAAAEAGDTDAPRVLQQTGRMIALKASGLWQSLGDGAGGHDDSLGNPYPPFAFNSGMWVREISRDEAEEFGLITSEQEAQPAELDLGSLLSEVAA